MRAEAENTVAEIEKSLALLRQLMDWETAEHRLEEFNAMTEDFDTTFPEEAFAEYLRCFGDPASLSATCEDYRAGATIDIVHDAEDKDAVLDMPMLAITGSKGLVGNLYDVEAIGRERARDVEVLSLPAGHFIQEELPDQTAAALVEFLKD